jgi:uncharacterized coiled-coil DUF342 family protein
MKTINSNPVIAIENRIALGEWKDFPSTRNRLKKIADKIRFGEKLSKNDILTLELNGI